MKWEGDSDLPGYKCFMIFAEFHKIEISTLFKNLFRKKKTIVEKKIMHYMQISFKIVRYIFLII